MALGYPHPLEVYSATSDGYGDNTVTLIGSMSVDAETFATWEHTNYEDQENGRLEIWFDPSETVYISLGKRLKGRFAVFETDWYRFTEVRPQRSIVSNEVEIIEASLEKVREQNASGV